ncbi:MAG TPA: hypothetical protein VKB36_07560 [Vicinamibacterales bacterium]|nr:hypothetical protein [Vicinamibacterales bacterium]
MNRSIWRHTTVLAALLAIAASTANAAAHPRIWLTPGLLSALHAKASSRDPDWLRVKAEADRLLAHPMPHFTVIGATNASPVQFTLAEPVPWSGSTPLFIGGATGAWAAVNARGDHPAPVVASRVGTHTFSVPIDSTAFGRFAGQRLALFFNEGGYSGYGYEGLDWQSTLQTLGLAYQVTRDAAYATKGIELVDYIASLGTAGMVAPESIDNGFPSRSAIVGFALAYDWFYDRMTPGDRAAAVEALNLWFDWFKRAGFENEGPAYGNYFGGHVLGFGLAGLATADDNPRGAEIAAHIASLFQTLVVPAFASGGFAGGYPIEAYTYGANHFQRILSYLLAVETATGADIPSRTGYAKKIARNLVYNLKPNNWQTSDEGDFAGDSTGVLPPSLPVVLSYVLAGTDEGGWMQYLGQHLAPVPHGSRASDSFVQCLFGDRSRLAADYRLMLPTWFRSPGDAHLYRRSSWQADAVWTSIAGGAAVWAGHQMRAAGHIAIQRGNDYLLVNSGQWKGATGDFGAPQSFDLRSWRGNTLFVDDSGDYLFTGVGYVGGQGSWGVTNVFASDGGPEFAYMKADLTSAYGVGEHKPWITRSVRFFHRSFLSTGNGVVVVFDRVQLRQSSYNKKLYFHLNPDGGRPTIAGDTTSIRVGRSALFIRTLLPAAPILAVAADPVSDTDNRPITYRLEVSDAETGQTFTALNVFIATPASAPSMPITNRLRSSSGTMVGASVADGAVERIALFSASGTAQFDVSYWVPALASMRTSMHVIADLVPNGSYSINRDSTALGSVTASGEGVLTFTSPPGGMFALRLQSGR